jgi:hypothetical protein
LTLHVEITIVARNNKRCIAGHKAGFAAINGGLRHEY